jgi:ATP-dependent RNA helicase DDX24/MAK5
MKFNPLEIYCRCREDEKDMYLYYLLKLHGQGRAVIFCTSIAAVRHIAAILSVLQIQAWPLHAQMQQKQRLKVAIHILGDQDLRTG